jgi:hypothetical protein
VDLNLEAPDLTPTEGKLAQTYVETMDFVSRCAQALEDGDWNYLADKACQLRNAANALEAAADIAKEEKPAPRTAAVLSAVTTRGGSYLAIERLHPGPFRR